MADDGRVSGVGEFEAVLAAAQEGQEWAVVVLFRDLQPRLLRFLRAQEPRVADDLAAEVWLAVASGIGGFTGDEPGFRAWVFTIARRRLIDHARRAVRRRTDVSEGGVFERLEASDAPEKEAIDNLGAQDAVTLVFELLPQEQAEVVLLRVLGDLDADQVAEIMGRSANWVRVTQHRALRRLADRLGPKAGVTR
jgi:RNA polymerase sigma-70 factor (ECF subfamily)